MSDWIQDGDASYIEMKNRDIRRLQSENEKLRKALERLRDCDWVISLPDRMDAVRAIAREALAEDTKTNES